jgi:hypothetical protein
MYPELYIPIPNINYTNFIFTWLFFYRGMN